MIGLLKQKASLFVIRSLQNQFLYFFLSYDSSNTRMKHDFEVQTRPRSSFSTPLTNVWTFLSNSIIKSIRKKRLYKKFLCHPTSKNERKYKVYKNKLNHIIKIAKTKHYEEKLLKYKNKTKLIWPTLNEIMNRTTHKHNLLPKEFSENNPEDIIKNPQEIANKFNEYFNNVGPGIANRLPTTNKAFNEYLSNKCRNSFFIKPVTKFEVETEIKNLNSQKSRIWWHKCKNDQNCIENNKILTKHQYSFRDNRSTELAIIEVTDRITKAIDKGEYTLGIFLDLWKAFDTINHKILIEKLEHYGKRGLAQHWFENYFTNRKQIVKYNEVRSKEMTIRTSGPQGSILGPILFLLYINGIENSSNLLMYHLYYFQMTQQSLAASSGSKKISRASGIIVKIRHFLSRNTMKLVYYALVYSYLI